MEKKHTVRGSAMLLLTALIWGVAFVAQSVGMDYVGPFTFSSVRCLLGGVVLLPCIVLLDIRAGKKPSLWGGANKQERKTLLVAGALCGAALAVASSLQQFGIKSTSVGKAGFLTALYIVLVPLLGLLRGKRAGRQVWLCVAIAMVGMYLLCVTESFTLAPGDILLLLSALCFAVHILVIDHFTGLVDGVRLSCVQFFVCSALCAVPMLLGEGPTLAALQAAWLPIAYAGVLSCGVAYTLQVVAQRDVPPAVASLVLSLESVFSVLAGWVLLGQALSARELSGCALVFAAILLAQLPNKSDVQAGNAA